MVISQVSGESWDGPPYVRVLGFMQERIKLASRSGVKAGLFCILCRVGHLRRQEGLLSSVLLSPAGCWPLRVFPQLILFSNLLSWPASLWVVGLKGEYCGK